MNTMYNCKLENIISAATLVIGSGAAGLNAAHELASKGHDVCLATASLGGGASFDAGSDKQTYYKLSIQGSERDSIADLADTFFSGEGMQGDHALVLAALSLRGFYKLVQLGVPFPHDAYGQYTGYKTDHDPRRRATSAGPLTSRYMGQALLKACREVGVRFVDCVTLASLLQDNHGRVLGALFIQEEEKPLVIAASQVVLCTGGSANVYLHTVYPKSQSGGLGHALRAGAKGNNLQYWQFGLGSVAVRWNLSGSYQQVIPAYYSTDRDGNNREYFLTRYFTSETAMLRAIFLKGYQWPFDKRKTGVDGSSLIDIAVSNEIVAGRRVFMDFRSNPAGMRYDFMPLPAEAVEYWQNSGCIADIPIDRLMKMNPDAVAFYKRNGLDLMKDSLEIAVNAQHQNGGLWVDEWWRTSLPGLYAAGECAGVFGMYRPGGSALNETQCGSLRVAQHILYHGELVPPDINQFMINAADSLKKARRVLLPTVTQTSRAVYASDILTKQREEMSALASVDPKQEELKSFLQNLKSNQVLIESGECLATPEELAEAREITAVMVAVVSSLLAMAEMEGNKAVVYTPGVGAACVPVRPIPKSEDWFENVWRDFRDMKVFGGKVYNENQDSSLFFRGE
ncbi:MAG: FAD-binding protein [Christensenellales bacterium]|jgi:succinate dehydrogenase/fumarate reductase flavoprotein subunit